MNIAVNIGLCIACAAFFYLLGAFVALDWGWIASSDKGTRITAAFLWFVLSAFVIAIRDIW